MIKELKIKLGCYIRVYKFIHKRISDFKASAEKWGLLTICRYYE